jgi:hypothetical protein
LRVTNQIEEDHSKIFANEDFGYRRIKVERPLRQNDEPSEERIPDLKVETKFQNRDEDPRERILETLRTMPDETWLDVKQLREDFVDTWNELFDETLYATEKDTVTDALGDTDDDAEVVVDRQGRKPADSDLRGYDNVPLTEDLDEYVAEEIEPYVPDAWIDEDYTRIGYERPRDPGEIEDDIRELESEIQKLLGEVLEDRSTFGTSYSCRWRRRRRSRRGTGRQIDNRNLIPCAVIVIFGSVTVPPDGATQWRRGNTMSPHSSRPRVSFGVPPIATGTTPSPAAFTSE